MDLQELIYKKRTQEGLTDGCAIFFNSDLMELISDDKVEYFQPDVYVSRYHRSLIENCYQTERNVDFLCIFH